MWTAQNLFQEYRGKLQEIWLRLSILHTVKNLFLDQSLTIGTMRLVGMQFTLIVGVLPANNVITRKPGWRRFHKKYISPVDGTTKFQGKQTTLIAVITSGFVCTPCVLMSNNLYTCTVICLAEQWISFEWREACKVDEVVQKNCWESSNVWPRKISPRITVGFVRKRIIHARPADPNEALSMPENLILVTGVTIASDK